VNIFEIFVFLSGMYDLCMRHRDLNFELRLKKAFVRYSVLSASLPTDINAVAQTGVSYANGCLYSYTLFCLKIDVSLR